jgi:hypothetical protein
MKLAARKEENNFAMRHLRWILPAVGLLGLQLWIFLTPWGPVNLINHPFVFLSFIVLFGAPSLGAFWMLYMVIRLERHPFPLVLVAFLPCGFLWYYFERVRPVKNSNRKEATA